MNGILFTQDNIKATAEGRKTVTRRLQGLKEINQEPDNYRLDGWSEQWGGYHFTYLPKPYIVRIAKPRYKVGEVVYIKEAYWFDRRLGTQANVKYMLDNDVTWVHIPKEKPTPKEGYHSPMMMPAWAARYFIKILDVRAERLQEITWEDTHKEGILRFDREHPDIDGGMGYNRGAQGLPMRYESIAAFMDLWNSINPKYPFESNPYIFRYAYELQK